MECYICKALEEKGEYRLDGSWASLEIIKENDGHYCNALGEGKASMSINFCPNCGCQLEDYKALKVLRLDDLDVEKEKGFDDSWDALIKIARVIHKESVRNALDIMLKTYEKSKYWAQLSLYEFAAREHMIDKCSDIYKLEELDFDQLVKDYTEYKSMAGNLKHATFGLDIGKEMLEKVECLYPSIPIYKDDNEELKKVVERRINAIKNRLRCVVCDGLGLTSMGAEIIGMDICQACHGTGLMDESIANVIKKYQEDIKELEEYVEYWQKECDRRQAKIDKALEDIDNLIAGTYMKTNGEATYGYYQSGCCTQRLNIIRDDLKGEED